MNNYIIALIVLIFLGLSITLGYLYQTRVQHFVDCQVPDGEETKTF